MTAATTTDTQTVTTALCAVLERVRTGSTNVHAVVVERHGRIVAELYRTGQDRSVWSPWAREIAFGPDVKRTLSASCD